MEIKSHSVQDFALHRLRWEIQPAHAEQNIPSYHPKATTYVPNRSTCHEF
jgi:hypothetical protein